MIEVVNISCWMFLWPYFVSCPKGVKLALMQFTKAMSKNDTLSSCHCVCPYEADETDIVNNMHWNFLNKSLAPRIYCYSVVCVSHLV